ncbi:MAG: hypothetical protein WBD31_24190 [Rubripirellula sp.]
MRHTFQLAVALRFIATIALATLAVHDAAASNWLTMPSTFTHDPVTGSRVSQYAPIAGPSAPQVSNFQTSGYTHTRSSLAYGQSADNYHRVESWGAPVRPYGEWNFPNRPFSASYQNWGPPYAGLNLGFGAGFGGAFPGYGPGFGQGPGAGNGTGQPNRPGHPHSPAGNASPFNPYPAGPGTPYPVAPYYDGYHPVYRE